MYGTVVIARVKGSSFFGADEGDLVAVLIEGAESSEDVFCEIKIRPESSLTHLVNKTWNQFFRQFDILAFTDYYKRGTWPQGWNENEGTIYWR